ncbi:MAG: hypothetical protein P8Z73_11755, partial [Desulfobacteraceae bacterium]
IILKLMPQDNIFLYNIGWMVLAEFLKSEQKKTGNALRKPQRSQLLDAPSYPCYFLKPLPSPDRAGA